MIFLVVFHRFPQCDACLPWSWDKQRLALRTWFTEPTQVIWAIPWKSGCLLSANGTRRRWCAISFADEPSKEWQWSTGAAQSTRHTSHKRKTIKQTLLINLSKHPQINQHYIPAEQRSFLSVFWLNRHHNSNLIICILTGWLNQNCTPAAALLHHQGQKWKKKANSNTHLLGTEVTKWSL